MLSKFITRINSIPARSAEWANRVGPAAMFGYDHGIRSSSSLLHHFFQSPRDCDYYAELTFHKEAPVECPPESVMMFPVLECGAMATGSESPSSEEWWKTCSEAATELTEKGYIPISVGGDGSATSCMIEGYKRLYPTEEVVVIHFSASPSLSSSTAPLRSLLEKNLLKGVVSVGNRCVSASDRKARKDFQTFYMDMHAIYSKGLFCIRDIRNDYPVFISINADVLDPACAPGVQNPIAGGLQTRELLHILHGIRGPKVVGIDLHGYDPALDVYRKDDVGLSQLALSKVLKEAVLKAYTISTTTEEEGIERVKMLQRQGTISKNPYPEY